MNTLLHINEYPCNGVVRRLKSRDDWSKIRNQRMAKALIPKPEALLNNQGFRFRANSS